MGPPVGGLELVGGEEMGVSQNAGGNVGLQRQSIKERRWSQEIRWEE